MIGDRYSVFYQLRSAPAETVPAGVHDVWKLAKAERDRIFNEDQNVTRAWIIRSNPSLNLRTDKRGFTMERFHYSSRQCVP